MQGMVPRGSPAFGRCGTAAEYRARSGRCCGCQADHSPERRKGDLKRYVDRGRGDKQPERRPSISAAMEPCDERPDGKDRNQTEAVSGENGGRGLCRRDVEGATHEENFKCTVPDPRQD